MKALTAILAVLVSGIVVVLLLFGGKFASSPSSADPDVVRSGLSAADPVDVGSTIPVTEGYSFNMTQEYIRSLLGVPYDTDQNEDFYFDVPYFGVSGHLVFRYSDGVLHGAYWESPAGISDTVLNNIFATVSEYFDNKVGSGEDVKYALQDEHDLYYCWIDEFNKTEYMLELYHGEKGDQVAYGFSKRIEFNFSQEDLEALQQALEDLDN